MTAERIEVKADWQCQGSGECCRKPKRVTMTYAERRELEAAAKQGLASRKLEFRYNKVIGMTDMVTGPCSFVTDDNKCNAYDVRPYSCRRFMCMRPDVSAEPLTDRMTDLRLRVLPLAREMYRENQAQAQPWALAHGWKAD